MTFELLPKALTRQKKVMTLGMTWQNIVLSTTYNLRRQIRFLIRQSQNITKEVNA